YISFQRYCEPFIYFNRNTDVSSFRCFNFNRSMRKLFTLLLFLFSFSSFAASITGEITDAHTNQQIADVSIFNIHTNVGTRSDAAGKFNIVAAKGQLIEFRKIGYKTLRIRIPEGTIPPYFRVIMQQGPVELPEFDLQAHAKDWKKDSIR